MAPQAARPVATRLKPKLKPASRPSVTEPSVTKPSVEATQAVPRDSAPMPRSGAAPAAEVLERGRLALAGAALALVALGGAIVLGASRRALAGVAA